MKKYLLIIFFANSLSAQIGYVKYNHPVYDFLERMGAIHLVNDFDPFEIPKSRKEISDYIKEVKSNENKLSNIDRKILSDLLIEFEFDINNSTKKYSALFNPSLDLGYLANQKEKFLYFFEDSTKFNLFVNFLGSGEYLFSHDRIESDNRNALLFTFGGQIRGTVFNNFGFSVAATNGTYSGSRSLASLKSNLRYNYKFNETGSTYFDETEGYLSAEFDYIRFKIGRDRMIIGSGAMKFILGYNAPPMDYLSMRIHYSIFSFSFFHGKLLGTQTEIHDPVQGTIRNITDKYLAYHRLALDFSNDFNLGIGEMIVYSNRNMDLSYLNPFNYYKSAEHANQDRDNSLLFFDFRNTSIKGLSFYASLLIDDIDFSKIGTYWYGNQILYNFSVIANPFYSSFPLTIGFQYLRLDPYVYSHRIFDNNYTSYEIGIGPVVEPNSETFLFDLKYKPHYRIDIGVSFQYTRHGANELYEDGSVKVNHGGDILVGHRPDDPIEAKFLDGVIEHTRTYGLILRYEPIKNIVLHWNSIYINTDKQSGIFDSVFSGLTLALKI